MTEGSGGEGEEGAKEETTHVAGIQTNITYKKKLILS